MFKVAKIEVTTSPDGLGDLPESLYVETAIEMIQNAYPGVEVEVVLREVFQTRIELEIEETGPREEDWMEERLGFECSETEDIGRILQEAFDAACSRA